MPKKEKKEKVEEEEVEEEKEKTYLVIDPDNADRVYTKEIHGFNLTLTSGKVEAVSAEMMELLKKASSFLKFEEVK